MRWECKDKQLYEQKQTSNPALQKKLRYRERSFSRFLVPDFIHYMRELKLHSLFGVFSNIIIVYLSSKSALFGFNIFAYGILFRKTVGLGGQRLVSGLNYLLHIIRLNVGAGSQLAIFQLFILHQAF